jgi:hypothetical protein
MIDAQILQRAISVGVLLQFTLVVVGHYVPWVKDNAFAFGGMMISGLAGLLYAREFAAGYGRGAMGGAIAGGFCALVGTAVSVLLGDIALVVLPVGTAVCVLTGAIGGLWGQLGARLSGR